MKWTFIAIGLNVNWNSNLVDRTGQFPWSPEVVIAIELFYINWGKNIVWKKGAKDVHYIYSAMWNEEHLFKLFTGFQIVENKRLVYFVDRSTRIRMEVWKHNFSKFIDNFAGYLQGSKKVIEKKYKATE